MPNIRGVIRELDDETLAGYIDIVHAMANNANAHVGLETLAHKTGRSVPAVAWDVEELRRAGLVELWKCGLMEAVCFTPLAANKLGLKLEEVDTGWKWVSHSKPAPPVVIAPPSSKKYAIYKTDLMRVSSPSPDYVAMWREHQVRTRRGGVPTRLIGISAICAREFAACPACSHIAKLRPDEYCIICDRWGQDAFWRAPTAQKLYKCRVKYHKNKKREAESLAATLAARKKKIKDRLKAEEAKLKPRKQRSRDK